VTLSSSPCTLNSGLGDNGAQVRAQGGGCWNISAASESLSPLNLGRRGRRDNQRYSSGPSGHRRRIVYFGGAADL
jgi:hypothetical protein